MFSRNSRWDRNLPDHSDGEQAIEVAALFKQGKVIPSCFVWQQRKYKIDQITFQWVERKGDQVLYHFSVTDKANLYLIFLNSFCMRWYLKEVVAV